MYGMYGTPMEQMERARIFAMSRRSEDREERLRHTRHIGALLAELRAAFVENPDLDAEVAICCAVLHNSMAHVGVTAGEIAEHFGDKVAAGVAALSKNPDLHGEEALRDMLDRIRQQPCEVWAVKLADMVACLTPDAAYCTDEHIREAELILNALGEASPAVAFVLAARLELAKNQLRRRFTA